MQHKPSIRDKRITLTQQRKTDKRLGMLMCTLLGTYVLYGMLASYRCIGHDMRHTIWVVLVPTLTGTAVYGVWQRVVFFRYLTDSDRIFRVMACIFFLCTCLFVGYFTFGFGAKAAWDYLNRREAASQPPEYITCQVDRFRAGKNASIDFHFRGQRETFGVTYQQIKPYKDSLPGAYYLDLTVQKGLWNYYIVDHWEVRHH